MSVDIEQITRQALALPDDARALLADQLAESLDPLEDAGVRAAWMAESNRRIEEIRSGKVKPIPGEEALARVRARFSR